MSDSESAAGRELGDFRILREIGRGGMGTVYLAEQRSLRRTVALKVLNPGVSLNPNVVKRFQREAEAAGRLHHPYIVQVFAVGEETGTYFFAMEYVDGESLDQIARRLRKGAKIDDLSTHPSEWSDFRSDAESEEGEDPETSPQDESEREGDSTDSTASETQEYVLGAARLMAEIADALDYAHRHGIIHRDVKPHNILVDRTGRPYLVDFGLAQAEGTMGITKTGEVFGTPTYMSPEQVAGSLGKIDHRTDVYSLGCSFYEVLTLHRPFEGKTPQETVRRILTVEPKDPRKFNSGVPKDLATIVVKCMEKDPDKRYRTAAELQADLKRFLAGEPILARPIGFLEKSARFVSRRSWQSAAVAAIAVLLLTVAFQGFRNRETSKDMHVFEAAKLAQEADGLYALDPKEAQSKVEQALSKDPRCAKAHLVNGKILRGQSRFEEARVAFDQAARFDPKDPEPHWAAGELLQGRREYRAAADLYREAIRLNPQLDAVHDSLGECLRELGLREESNREFEMAEKIRLEAATPLLEEGRRVLQEGLEASDPGSGETLDRFAKAEALFTKMLQKHPSMHAANLWRGVARARRFDFAGAMDDFDEVVARDPRDPAAFFFRAEAHLAQGKREEGRQDLEKVLSLEKSGERFDFVRKARFLLAQVLVSLQEWEKALAQLTFLLNEEENQEARLLRAVCHAVQSSPAEAEADFLKAASAGGEMAAAAALGQAFLLEAQGASLKAYADLVEAEKLHSQDARLFYHRGRIGIGLHRKSASDRAALDRAIELDPSNAGAYLARFSARLEEPAAEKDFFEALDLDPEFAVAHFFEGIRGDFSGWMNFLSLVPERLLGVAPRAPRSSSISNSREMRFLSPRWRAGKDIEMGSCAPVELKGYIGDLRSPAPKVREYAEKQLFECGWNALAALRTVADVPGADPTLKTLPERLEESRHLAERMQMEEWIAQMAFHSSIANRVADLGIEALPSLIRVLADANDPMSKHRAYKTIVGLQGSGVAESLTPLLSHADPSVRFYALRAMTSLESVPSPEALRTLFSEDSSPIRIAVLLAAGMAGELHDSMRAILADSLTDARALTRFIGARLIGDRRDRSLLPQLRHALMVEEEPEVRGQIFRSLSSIGEEGASLWSGMQRSLGIAGSRGSGTAEAFFRALPGSARISGRRGDGLSDDILLSRFQGPEFHWVRIHWVRTWDVPQLIRHLDVLQRMSESAHAAERFAGHWGLRRLGLGGEENLPAPEGAAVALARSFELEGASRPLRRQEREALLRVLDEKGRTKDAERIRKEGEAAR